MINHGVSYSQSVTSQSSLVRCQAVSSGRYFAISLSLQNVPAYMANMGGNNCKLTSENESST